ncbi:hypothetical protein DUNSADRAFT_12235 [Dunaliella salina]|uniref:Guanylate cyclase domain-containing protein n=1 Tax=Dunaliella salina TaxID=3046 RepID=A0ABQ7GBP7_DUNSA|nr:hypothetical protein DUNSADRAFT_12235 [Dunaliella salina]|eukprot:KAF5832019.1 hypothetical protein DUNSADRAFT_12235 [Dunaliella salina]
MTHCLSFFSCSCAALLKLTATILLHTQGNVGNDAFTTSGVQAQPSHYFESIPEGRRPKISNLPGELSSGQQLLDTIINSEALDRFSLGMGAASQPLPLPSKIQAGTLPPLQLTSRRDHAQSASATLPHVPLRTYARDTMTTCSGSGPSVGFVDDATSKKATGTSERPTWSSCQVDEIPLDVAPVPPSKSTCQPKGQAGALTDAPSCSRMSVHSAAEESVMAPEHSWHYIDAFNIKSPAGEKLTVLTNQDVTYLVETQISLKQILDVEHKILEDIFPKHVLETQVATGAGLGRGLNDSLGVPLACSSRRQSSGSHLSSTTVGRVPSFRNLRDERGPGDVSPIRIESCIDMRSTDHKGGKHLENGTTSPLPKTTSAEFYRKSIRHDVLPVQESSQLHRLCIDSGSHDTIGDGRGHSLTGAPFLPASQGHNSGEHEGALSFENAGLLRTRNSEGLPSTQGHMSNASSVLGDRAYGGNNRRDVVKGRLGTLRAPPKRNHSCSTVFQSSTAYSPRSTGLHLPIDYGSGPNSSARSFAPKPTLSGMGRHHENVTVMFADIKEFTSMSRAISSAEVMHFLHTLFSRFDALVDAMEELGLYKIETIGDCYMCAAGLLTRGEDGAMVLWEGDKSPVHHLFTLARKMLEVASGMEMPASGGQPVVLRIGMHTGPVTSGIAGRKCPRFCLFGDTVNFAARMESTCLPGMIHMSQATWEALGSPDQAADPRW